MGRRPITEVATHSLITRPRAAPGRQDLDAKRALENQTKDEP